MQDSLESLNNVYQLPSIATQADAPVKYRVVFNPGNGFVKLMVIGDKAPIVMSSGITWKSDGESREKATDFKILRDPLVKSPLFAKGAWWSVDAEGDRPLDFESGGKPVYALPLLVSAIWKRLEKDNVDNVEIDVYIQVHNPKDTAIDIRSRMENTFCVSRKGVEKRIKVNVVAVRREGSHMISMLSNAGNSVILDWGGNTLIASRYDGRKLAQGFEPLPEDGLGSSGLARLLVSQGNILFTGTRNVAKAHDIIRNAEFDSDEKATAFYEICRNHISGSLRQVNKHNPGIFDNVDNVFAIGGLCKCKPFVKALESMGLEGFQVVKDPQTVDIRNMALKYANVQD
jgi:hypothetical protein